MAKGTKAARKALRNFVGSGGKHGGRSVTKQATETLGGMGDRFVRTAKAAGKEIPNVYKKGAQTAAGVMGSKPVADLKKLGADVVSGAKGGAGQMGDRVSEALGNVPGASKIKEGTGELADAVKGKGKKAYQKAKGQADAVKGKVDKKVSAAKDTFDNSEIGKDINTFTEDTKAEVQQAVSNHKARVDEKRAQMPDDVQQAYADLGAAGAEFRSNLAGTDWRLMAGQAAITGTATAVVGAGVNAARGEDVWDGATTGFMAGAGLSTGARIVKQGVGTSGALVPGVKAFNAKHNVSSSANTLMKNSAMAKYASEKTTKARAAKAAQA